MQPLGVLLITMGVWLVYSGVTGIAPLQTLAAIITDPSNASKIIAEARAESAKNTAVPGGLTEGFSKMGKGGNPFANWKVSDDFAAHRARGSQGGTDYPVPVGTPIFSPFSGILTNSPNAGAAGNKVTIDLGNGWKFVAMHLSRFRDDLNGKRVMAGQIIGYTGGAKGAPGAGSSTGPHLHVNMINPQGQVSDYVSYIGRTTFRNDGGKTF